MTFGSFDVRESLKKNSLPTLFIHGDADEVVPKECFVENYSACSAEKDSIVVCGAGHTVALIDGGEEAMNKFYEFVNKHLSSR